MEKTKGMRVVAPIQLPCHLQGYLAHKNTQPPRTLPKAYAQGPGGVLGGWAVSYERGDPVRARPLLGVRSPLLDTLGPPPQCLARTAWWQMDRAIIASSAHRELKPSTNWTPLAPIFEFVPE